MLIGLGIIWMSLGLAFGVNLDDPLEDIGNPRVLDYGADQIDFTFLPLRSGSAAQRLPAALFRYSLRLKSFRSPWSILDPKLTDPMRPVYPFPARKTRPGTPIHCHPERTEGSRQR